MDTLPLQNGHFALSRHDLQDFYLNKNNFILLDKNCNSNKNRRPPLRNYPAYGPYYDDSAHYGTNVYGEASATPMTEKERQTALKDYMERRQKFLALPPAEQTVAQNNAIRKQWLWIAKKEIPRMHKLYIRYFFLK